MALHCPAATCYFTWITAKVFPNRNSQLCKVWLSRPDRLASCLLSSWGQNYSLIWLKHSIPSAALFPIIDFVFPLHRCNQSCRTWPHWGKGNHDIIAFSFGDLSLMRHNLTSDIFRGVRLLYRLRSWSSLLGIALDCYQATGKILLGHWHSPICFPFDDTAGEFKAGQKSVMKQTNWVFRISGGNTICRGGHKAHLIQLLW